MKCEHTKLTGLLMIESDLFEDERGSFEKTFCARELDMKIVNSYLASNHKTATLRGMHYQEGIYAEDKLVRCLRGQIFDVAVDLRPDSKTYRQWLGLELSEQNHRAFYIPKGFAHGFVTLTDHTLIQYQVSNFYEPRAERGLRWDDPEIAIQWPVEPKVMSERDKSHPLL